MMLTTLILAMMLGQDNRSQIVQLRPGPGFEHYKFTLLALLYLKRLSLTIYSNAQVPQ